MSNTTIVPHTYLVPGMSTEVCMIYRTALKKNKSKDYPINRVIAQHRGCIYVQTECGFYDDSLPQRVKIGIRPATSILFLRPGRVEFFHRYRYIYLPGTINNWKFVSYLRHFPFICNKIAGLIERRILRKMDKNREQMIQNNCIDSASFKLIRGGGTASINSVVSR